MSFSPLDPQFEARVRASFARQRAMETIGATLGRVEPGVVEVALPYRADLTQQHGFLHAGIVATILDSACGYAAFSLMAPDVAVLTVEYKINLLRPAQGDRFIATGRSYEPDKQSPFVPAMWSHMPNPASGWLRRCWPPCSPRPSVTD